MWSRSGSTGTARSVTVIEVPSSARSRIRGDSFSSPWNTTQVSRVERSTADRMPSLASFSTAPVNASDAISSETVNPMPATVPTPSTAPQPTGGDSRPRVTLLTSQAVPAVPTGLPTT
jgi:hypothetical protein